MLFFWRDTWKFFLSQVSWNGIRKGRKYALKIYIEESRKMTLQLEVKKMLKACVLLMEVLIQIFFFSPCRSRYTGTWKWMHAGSAKCVSNCLSLIIDNIDRAHEFFFHIKDNCAWVSHSLKLNVLSAPGTSMYVLWKISPLDEELECVITFIYLDCSGIQRAKAGLVSCGDRWWPPLPHKEAVAYLHPCIIFLSSESSEQDLWPSRLLPLRWSTFLLCRPLFYPLSFSLLHLGEAKKRQKQLLQISPIFYSNLEEEEGFYRDWEWWRAQGIWGMS